MCLFSKSSTHEAFDPIETNEIKKTMDEDVVKSPDVNKTGWLMKKEQRMISSWEKEFCVVVNGCAYYFNSARSDERGYELLGR